MTVYRDIESREWQWVVFASAAMLLIISIPFIWATALAVPDQVFGGSLVNPIDGVSYLAKMQQGYDGGWYFTLPYTLEPHAGVVVYTFYLGMGHVARLTGLPLVEVYTIVRLVGTLVMLLAVYRLVADWTADVTQRRITWGLISLGSGFGILLLPFGVITPDVLILPEAFPLQAAYTNAHFPWAIGLAAYLVHVLVNAVLVPDDPATPELNGATFYLAFGSLALASFQAFVLIPIGLGYGAMLIWRWVQRRRFPTRELAWGGLVLIFSLPLLAYQVWVFSDANPVFAAWLAQNATLSPPLWHYLVAFGPTLLLALIGVWGLRQNLEAGHIFLLGWALACAALLYAPLGLQRRFAMGLVLPLGIFAGIGMMRVLLPLIPQRLRLVALVGLFSMTLPTTLLSIITPMPGLLLVEDSPRGNFYFISRDEQEALRWIDAQPTDRPIVLASPEISLHVPIYHGRVIYAHPYETIDAFRREALLDAYLDGSDCEAVLEIGTPDFIFIGPRERARLNTDPACYADYPLVFANDSIQIYGHPRSTP